MAIRQLIVFALAAALAAARPAHAQEWATPVVRDSGLRALVAEALERNPGVLGRRALVVAADRRVAPAGWLPDPTVEIGSIDVGRTYHAFSQLQLEIEQQIPWPGALTARAGAARAERQVATGEALAARRDVALRVAAVYYRLRYLATARETLRRQRQLLKAGVELATARYATGLAPQSDPLQARLARERLTAEDAALEGER
ncbi:MAG: TolC family protein, partial [Gemmatimonadales bacterium]